jgi:hypothetical protein
MGARGLRIEAIGKGKGEKVKRRARFDAIYPPSRALSDGKDGQGKTKQTYEIA